jgi:hypothetical protein
VTIAAMLLWEFHFRTRGFGSQALCMKGAATCASTPPAVSPNTATTGMPRANCMPRLPLIGAPMRLLLRMGAA